MLRTFLFSHFWLEKPLSALHVITLPWSLRLALRRAENTVFNVWSTFLNTFELDESTELNAFESGVEGESLLLLKMIDAAGFELSTTQFMKNSSFSRTVSVPSMRSNCSLGSALVSVGNLMYGNLATPTRGFTLIDRPLINAFYNKRNI